MEIVAQLIRVAECGSVGQGFESLLSPSKNVQDIINNLI